MQAVIMAGGKGTRLASITKGEIPKPMVPVEGKPLLLWQILQLKDHNITHITLVTGYLGNVIREYFGDGKKFGVSIDYVEEKQPLGTAGAFYYLKDIVKDRYFMLVFGDLFFDIDIERMEMFHTEHKALATLFVHPNSHPFDSDLVILDGKNRVERFDSKNNIRNYYFDNCVNAGMYILDRSILDRVKEPVKTDFEKDLLAVMAQNGEDIYGYRSPEYVKDVGTVERIESASEDLKSGFIASRNLSHKQKAIFIDRDGCINEYRGFISNEKDFELIPDVSSAIKKINGSGYLAIVVSNQPVIARGECSMEELNGIFDKMKTLLGKEGAYVDDVYFCPHHPDAGFEGERPEYKIECECRKPKPGMLIKASEDYNIDLEKSWMIGDATGDIKTGNNAGCHTALVLTGQAGLDKKYDVSPEITGRNLLEAADKILSR